MKRQDEHHASFWASLWGSDEFVSLVNRVVMMASASGGGWLVARGYMNAELAGLIGLLVLTVSQKFSSWNRGRATSKAAQEAIGITELAGVDVQRMAEVDIGVCASCGQESVLGVGEEKCRGCLLKGVGQTRIPIGLRAESPPPAGKGVGPVGGGDAETKG